MFSLGLLILKIGLGKSINEIYGKDGFDFEHFGAHLNEFKTSYQSNRCLVVYVCRLLEMNPRQQQDPISFQNHLKESKRKELSGISEHTEEGELANSIIEPNKIYKNRKNENCENVQEICDTVKHNRRNSQDIDSLEKNYKSENLKKNTEESEYVKEKMCRKINL